MRAMNKYLKSDIRHDAIRTRSLKKTYKFLTEPQKKLVKKVEERDQVYKSIEYLWNQAKYDDAGKVIQSTMNWDEFHRLNKKVERINLSIEWLEQEHYLDEEKVMKFFNQTNTGRFYGGSY